MKTLLFLVLLHFGGSNSNPSANHKFQETKVYVCVSSSSFAYHNKKNCRGLKACTHEIKEVEESHASKTMKRKKCGYCYK